MQKKTNTNNINQKNKINRKRKTHPKPQAPQGLITFLHATPKNPNQKLPCMKCKKKHIFPLNNNLKKPEYNRHYQ